LRGFLFQVAAQRPIHGLDGHVLAPSGSHHGLENHLGAVTGLGLFDDPLPQLGRDLLGLVVLHVPDSILRPKGRGPRLSTVSPGKQGPDVRDYCFSALPGAGGWPWPRGRRIRPAVDGLRQRQGAHWWWHDCYQFS